MKAYASVIALVVAFSVPASAQSVDARKVAEDISAKHVAAFNKNDASALASLFSPNLVNLPPTGGEPLFSRAEYEKRWTAVFAADAPSEKVSITSADALDDHTVIATGEWGYTPSKGANAGKETHGRWMAVYVKENGGWTVKALSGSVPTTPPAPPVASGSSNKQ
ncbi:MAG TPA: nuclear transport factor 2 family protein [Stellaceae bacterium]|nr:nuclear transport factor 2 family protein [Stellaceae bacterium]